MTPFERVLLCHDRLSFVFLHCIRSAFVFATQPALTPLRQAEDGFDDLSEERSICQPAQRADWVNGSAYGFFAGRRPQAAPVTLAGAARKSICSNQ
jgi:hypothetical protein